MNRKQWRECTDPRRLLMYLKGSQKHKVSDRKLRLLGVACCRRAWHLLPPGSRQALEVMERYADGEIGAADKALAEARQAAIDEMVAAPDASGYGPLSQA